MPRNCWTRCNKTFPCSFPAREKTREIESRETSKRLEKQAILALLRKMIYKSKFEEANVMRSTDKIIDYLEKTYQPESIIVYGSFADGSANLNSDFDALIIAGKEKQHDSSFVDGVVLDVFVYPPDQFLSEYDPAEFAQVWDGKIILDKNGMGERLKKNVLDYIERIPLKTEEDISQEIKWCEKMLLRTMRGDVEGYYRWHWVLCDSLEISLI